MSICHNFVESSSVSIVGSSLVINVPEASYRDGAQFCLGISQQLPSTATINMPVVLTIDTSTTQYPLIRCSGNPVTASNISFRDILRVRVQANSASIIIKVINKVCCAVYNNPIVIPANTTGGTP